MLCPKCSKEISEGLDFCTECGASITTKNKNTKNKKIAIGVIIVVLLCAAAYFSGILSPATASAEETAKAALDAYLSFNSDDTLALFPKKYISWAADKFYGGDGDGFEEMLRDKAETNKSYFKTRYGTAWSYSDVTVSKVYDYPASQVEALNEDYDAIGLKLKVKSAKKIKLKYTLSYLNEDDRRIEESHEYEAFVINVGGKWYLCDE